MLDMLIYTNQSSGRKRKSQSKRLAAAKIEHQKFLASVGYHGKLKRKYHSNMPDLKVENGSSVADVSNAIPANGFKRSVDDWRWKRDRVESAETVKEIERKKTRVAPAFNKGATMYVSDGMDPASLGRKV
jgi:hypothetical protein